MTVLIENIRKLMGWCPQEKVIYNHEDVPIQMYDWRIFVILFGFIGLLLIVKKKPLKEFAGRLKDDEFKKVGIEIRSIGTDICQLT